MRTTEEIENAIDRLRAMRPNMKARTKKYIDAKIETLDWVLENCEVF